MSYLQIKIFKFIIWYVGVRALVIDIYLKIANIYVSMQSLN